MRIDLFDFDLPPEAIAQRPASPRDSARLLRIGDGDGFGDFHVRDLPDLLRPGDLLVSNDTKVIPARLEGRRGDARVEVTLHKSQAALRWQAFARPARKLKAGDIVDFAPGFSALVEIKGAGGEVTLAFRCPDDDLPAALARHGIMPLPPYIKSPKTGDARDDTDYQTVFAAKPGAVAAPTAGLHFTPELLARLDARGILRLTVTLHVGAGTFLPVTSETTEGHVMHAEYGVLDAAAAETIDAARRAGGRLVAVGTTSLRLIETAADDTGRVHPFAGDTRLFIVPGYRFKAVDLLLTNFHLPRSTLFMLVSAFAGTERMKAAYAHALANGYRFYSYGDGCLLNRGAAA